VIKLLVQDPNRDEICDKLRRFVFEDMPVLIKPSERFRNVLTHDDLWCNNMLFNDRAECVFVDFQMSRYTPPAVDFLLALYVNLEPSYVETNLGRYVDFYYSSLEQELEKNNLDNSELPKTEFLKTLQHYKLMALTEVVMYGTHVYISEDLANQIVSDFNNYNEFSFINRSKFAIKEIRDNPQYRDRLTGVVAVLVKTLAHK
jgi:thiamine kinase-like enzyme